MVSGIVCIAFSLSIGLLFVVHTYILMKNGSTIELSSLVKNNPFDKGSYYENLS